MIRIVIADDQRLMREGLQTILQLEEDMDVVFNAENGREAYEAAGRCRPHIVLMDVKMPVMDGVEALKLIKRDYPHIVVLMLTTFAEEKIIVDALASGANGFLLKDFAADRVVRTVRDAIAGELLLPPLVAAKLAARVASQIAYDFDEAKLSGQGLVFTDRERKIILLLVEGYTNKQIAATLFMSEGTVRNYVSVIYGKIGTNDRRAAADWLKELLLRARL
ncbi:response regulator transcription factor [Cohnella sp. REN36]|uniref:response regulator transcription factor n=1 Tax=Cohnella sp. REN36 TaxID=2887347 RepID=UPI001D15E3FB|nr:response regulator transcription factor [Cohnella sp. REN36]MCC3374378.1 response regulator transcription factor [Cohnella sp. REN36]